MDMMMLHVEGYGKVPVFASRHDVPKGIWDFAEYDGSDNFDGIRMYRTPGANNDGSDYCFGIAD